MSEQLTVITRKGQVTIPAEIRRALGLKKGDSVAWILEKDHVRLRRSRGVVARTAGILRDENEKSPLTAEEERAAVEQALAEEVVQRIAAEG